MRALVPLLFAFAVSACDGDSDTDTDLDTGTETDTEADTEAAGTEVYGVVTDSEGAALSGVRVNLCRQVCYTAETDATGAYRFDFGLTEQRYSLHVETVGDLEAVDGSVPYTLAGEDPVEIDLIVPTAVPMSIPAVAAELEVATDLLLTVGAGDLTVLFEDDPTEISAARVAMDDWMPIDLEGDVQAVWYLDPWSADADPAVALRIRDTFGTSGDTYTLFQANYDDAEWDTLGTLTSDGAYLTGDIALTRLDTLVLVSATTR